MPPDPESPFDPLGVAPFMMTWWRMTMFDLPMAFAAEMSASFERWMDHQAEFAERLGRSQCLEDVASAQTHLMDESIEDYRKSSAALTRDLKLTVESAVA
jgi:hypothetical protein